MNFEPPILHLDTLDYHYTPQHLACIVMLVRLYRLLLKTYFRHGKKSFLISYAVWFLTIFEKSKDFAETIQLHTVKMFPTFVTIEYLYNISKKMI